MFTFNLVTSVYRQQNESHRTRSGRGPCGGVQSNRAPFYVPADKAVNLVPSLTVLLFEGTLLISLMFAFFC